MSRSSRTAARLCTRLAKFTCQCAGRRHTSNTGEYGTRATVCERNFRAPSTRYRRGKYSPKKRRNLNWLCYHPPTRGSSQPITLSYGSRALKFVLLYHLPNNSRRLFCGLPLVLRRTPDQLRQRERYRQNSSIKGVLYGCRSGVPFQRRLTG
jgi:hypothetical protein